MQPDEQLLLHLWSGTAQLSPASPQNHDKYITAVWKHQRSGCLFVSTCPPPVSPSFTVLPARLKSHPGSFQPASSPPANPVCYGLRGSDLPMILSVPALLSPAQFLQPPGPSPQPPQTAVLQLPSDFPEAPVPFLSSSLSSHGFSYTSSSSPCIATHTPFPRSLSPRAHTITTSHQLKC